MVGWCPRSWADAQSSYTTRPIGRLPNCCRWSEHKRPRRSRGPAVRSSAMAPLAHCSCTPRTTTSASQTSRAVPRNRPRGTGRRRAPTRCRDSCERSDTERLITTATTAPAKPILRASLNSYPPRANHSPNWRRSPTSALTASRPTAASGSVMANAHSSRFSPRCSNTRTVRSTPTVTSPERSDGELASVGVGSGGQPRLGLVGEVLVQRRHAVVLQGVLGGVLDPVGVRRLEVEVPDGGDHGADAGDDQAEVAWVGRERVQRAVIREHGRGDADDRDDQPPEPRPTGPVLPDDPEGGHREHRVDGLDQERADTRADLEGLDVVRHGAVAERRHPAEDDRDNACDKDDERAAERRVVS